jgi:hypothetical protein
MRNNLLIIHLVDAAGSHALWSPAVEPLVKNPVIQAGTTEKQEIKEGES